LRRPDRMGRDLRVARGRLELGVSEQGHAIMRTFLSY
jgi:hypothetical protein